MLAVAGGVLGMLIGLTLVAVIPHLSFGKVLAPYAV